jgi:hypothetical protein
VKIDSAGTANAGWSADTDFTGGVNGQVNNGAVDVTGVLNPAPQTVYQTTRSGSFTYTVPGFSGGTTHRVRLHFCETYFPPAGDTASGVGRRLCTISINGGTVLTAFDIFAKVGKMKADVEEFNLPSTASGQYVIQFTPTKDNCTIGGIEIE